MPIKILAINPNSTASMTGSVVQLLSTITPSDVVFVPFTAPAPAPPSINDSADCQTSADVALPLLLPILADYAGFIVCCYSEHPLVPMLKSHTSSPVVGIFEASVTASLHLLRPGQKFGIVTTGRVWEELLGAGVHRFLGGAGEGVFAGVESTGLTAVQLHEVAKEEVERRIGEAAERLLRRGDVGVVCLGCAGMVGMGEAVGRAAGRVKVEVRVVDGVVAAAGVVVGLVRGMRA
ncbi:uncharacterized protein H6S33_011397 [Morchella sextelata]|uniref:uncharacterized protein n=1 Tax=Morchella sextelata TaxID=1174677 RepID=UPI001D03835F|nr:uncharacterized protein H6S33_011397 [Morchella sextelata]KAH0610970.1 hypothetical protein H6S33_011397 [Morchella sextelata]